MSASTRPLPHACNPSTTTPPPPLPCVSFQCCSLCPSWRRVCATATPTSSWRRSAPSCTPCRCTPTRTPSWCVHGTARRLWISPPHSHPCSVLLQVVYHGGERGGAGGVAQLSLRWATSRCPPLTFTLSPTTHTPSLRQAYVRGAEVDHGSFVSSYVKRVLYQLDPASDSDGEV